MPAHLGFIQGRLSPLDGGRTQSFPWDYWKDEFPLAQQLNLPLIEWTLDRERLDENPIMTPTGRRDLTRLSRTHHVRIETLTGDCFMQAPFHRERLATARSVLLADAQRVIQACSEVGIGFVVLPIVDEGAIQNEHERKVFIAGIRDLLNQPSMPHDVQLLLECEEEPDWIAALLKELATSRIGINYDTGNSAARGYNPVSEFAAYGSLVANVHVKDRELSGMTVPLGSGAADFDSMFRELVRLNYCGRYILQTARAEDGDHVNALRHYRDFVLARIQESGCAKPALQVMH